MKKNLIFFIIFFICVIFYPNFTQAKTLVVSDGCDIKITVYLAFSFLDDISWERAQQLAGVWTNDILKIWNQPSFNYGECGCPVSLSLVTKSLPKGEDCSYAKKYLPNYHCIDIVNLPINKRGNIADSTIISAQNLNSYGEWTTQTTGINAAHEIGHMLGLEGEYRRDNNGNWVNKNIQTGLTQSIMAKAWGEVTSLSEHIDKTIQLSGAEYPMPENCCGDSECKLSIKSTSTLISVFPSSLTFNDNILQKPFVINNNGEDILSWEVTSDLPAWLELSSTKGAILPGEKEKILAEAKKEEVLPGEKTSELVLKFSNEEEIWLPVFVVVEVSI